MDRDVAVRTSRKDLTGTVPGETEKFRVLSHILSFKYKEWRLLVSQIPQLEKSIKGARHKDIFDLWVDRD